MEKKSIKRSIIAKALTASVTALLTIFPSLAKAHQHYPSHYRVHYSPYAFSNENPSGLVFSDLKYSPYAFSPQNSSGLVPYSVHYSPYAFSNENPSGLVADFGHWGWHNFIVGYHPEYAHAPYLLSHLPTPPIHEKYPGIVSFNGQKRELGEKIREREARTEQLKKESEKAKEEEKLNERNFIFEYLQSKGINDIKTNNILKIKNKTLSIDFFIRDKNLVIKYLNIEDIKQIIHHPLYKNFFESYIENWKKLGEKYIKDGWQVKLMEASSEGEIKSKLEEILK